MIRRHFALFIFLRLLQGRMAGGQPLLQEGTHLSRIPLGTVPLGDHHSLTGSGQIPAVAVLLHLVKIRIGMKYALAVFHQLRLHTVIHQ